MPRLRFPLYLAVTFLACAALHPSLASAAEPLDFRAATAQAVITPKTSLWLGGYAARTRPSDGTTQDLFCKVLAVEDTHQGRFIFVTLDAIGVTRGLRNDVEKRLAAAYQVKPHEFVVNASHTHSGPEYRPARVPIDGRGSEEAAQAYAVFMAETIERVVGEALRNLAPARLSYARARAGFAMNRRLPRPGAEPNNAPHPDGPVDHDVPVLRVDAPDGKLRAILFGYACHNTTLTQAFYQFCGDYSGYAQEFLEADHPGVMALFLTGAGADQNPYPRGTLEQARIHGRSLASAVEAALATKPRALAGPIRSAYADTVLKSAPPPPREEYVRRMAGKDRGQAAHAKRMIERLDRDGKLPTTYSYPVQVVQFGDTLKVIALGAELVVDYSLRLKQQHGGSASVWVAGYSNDIIGYIPSERVLQEGGYEGLSAIWLGILPSPWAPGLEDQIIAKVDELVRATSAQGDRR